MYFFVFLAHPKPTHDVYGTVDGAYVACWVDEPTLAIGEGVARSAIEDAGWDIEDLEEVSEKRRDDFLHDPVKLDRFDQALIDGCVLEFNKWPVGAPEEE